MSSYYRTADSDWYKQRLNGVMLWVMAVFVVLVARLFYLQVIEGREYRRLSENNCIRLQSLDASRGLIFDRTGKLLVENRPSFDLSIILKDAKPVEETIEKLAEYMNVPVRELMSRISGGNSCLSYKPVLLKRDIGRDVLAAIEVHKFDLPGVIVNVKPIRHYIKKQSAAHLLGYLGEINAKELKRGVYKGCKPGDFIGKFGVEKVYERYLRGERGGRQVEVDVTGQMVRVLKTVETRPGHNILLTIDQELQQKTEELLKGLTGAAAAMNPSTGQVLALVSSPSFDQNAFVTGLSHKQWRDLRDNPAKPMSNKVVQGEYPPASTYKIVTAMACLEEGVIDETTTFFCPGHYRLGNRVFRCWKRGGHGDVDIVKALTESCDVFFYRAGEMLGVDRLAWYAVACGLGAPTGIDLDHEGKGLIPTAAWKKKHFGVPWQRGETLPVAIGQGFNLVTPMQMLVLTSAVANGGIIKKPFLLKSIETVEGTVVYKNQSRNTGKLPFSIETMEIVKKSLWKVANEKEGTAYWHVHINDLDISGKTGTAQVVSRKRGDTAYEEDESKRAEHLKPHAWFVAYAPSEKPEIAIAVIVEHGGHGSSSAGPIAREMIKTYLLKETPPAENLMAERHPGYR